MPPKRKFTKKKFQSKRRSGARSVSLITSKPSSGMPNSIIIKHKYCESFSTTTTTSPHTQVYRLNSLFDPNHTGVGHQPYYHDQMALLYNKYTVYGCKVTVRGNCASQPAILGMKTQRDTTVVTAAIDACERPDVVYRMMADGGKSHTLSMYISLPAKFGVSKSEYLGEGDFAAVAASNPAKEWYLQIFAQHPNSATGTSIFYTAELVYYTRWSERIRVISS